MAISDLILSRARAIAALPGFRDQGLHQIGKSGYFVASAPEHAEGHKEKGKIAIGPLEYPIVFIPRTY